MSAKSPYRVPGPPHVHGRPGPPTADRWATLQLGVALFGGLVATMRVGCAVTQHEVSGDVVLAVVAMVAFGLGAVRYYLRARRAHRRATPMPRRGLVDPDGPRPGEHVTRGDPRDLD